jgi:hypothetical protein
MVNQFFAVTAAGVYRVSTERDERGVPTVELVANRDCDPDHALGSRLGRFNEARHTIGVCTLGIYLYDPIGRDPVERTDGTRLGDHTLGLAALFLDRGRAAGCLYQRGEYAGESLDHRFAEDTLKTLAAIGPDHPVFVISPDNGFGFGRLRREDNDVD